MHGGNRIRRDFNRCVVSLSARRAGRPKLPCAHVQTPSVLTPSVLTPYVLPPSEPQADGTHATATEYPRRLSLDVDGYLVPVAADVMATCSEWDASGADNGISPPNLIEDSLEYRNLVGAAAAAHASYCSSGLWQIPLSRFQLALPLIAIDCH